MTSQNDDAALVFLSLGSNILPEQNLRRAVRLLRTHCHLIALSPVYQTPAQGDTHQADFLNMAVQLTTTLSPAAFKTQVIAEIEQRLGRVRDPHNKNAPRTIDLDIALWNREVLDYGDRPWHVPDPDITRFAHVAVPLAEIAPDYIHPETGQTLAAIAGAFNTATIKRVELDFSDDTFIVNIEGGIWRDGRYLTIIRGEEEDHAAGLLAFVGGKVEGVAALDDDVFENTLKREIREEVGLEVDQVTYVQSRMFTADNGDPVINVVFLCRWAGGSLHISDPGEVADAQWLRPQEILAHPRTPPWISGYLQAIEQVRIRLGW